MLSELAAWNVDEAAFRATILVDSDDLCGHGLASIFGRIPLHVMERDLLAPDIVGQVPGLSHEPSIAGGLTWLGL